jgi:hypothetical protein
MKKNKFKLIELLVCFVAALVMVSCDKVDGAKIVGTWGCVHSYQHFWDTYSGVLFREYEDTDVYKGCVVNIKDDGSYSSVSYDHVGLFSKNGGIWMIDDGNNLLIDGESCVIQTLNNTTLKLKYQYDHDHYDYESHEETTLEFKRQ